MPIVGGVAYSDLAVAGGSDAVTLVARGGVTYVPVAASGASLDGVSLAGLAFRDSLLYPADDLYPSDDLHPRMGLSASGAVVPTRSVVGSVS